MNLSHKKPHTHVGECISTCRKACYVSQGSGLRNLKTNADTASYVWKTAIGPVLTLAGLNTLKIDKM